MAGVEGKPAQEGWQENLQRILFHRNVAWPLWIALTLLVVLIVFTWLGYSGNQAVVVYFSVGISIFWFATVFWSARVIATSRKHSSFDWIAVVIVFILTIAGVFLGGFAYFAETYSLKASYERIYVVSSAFFGNGMFDSCAGDKCAADRLMNITLSSIGYLHSTIGLTILWLWLKTSNDPVKQPVKQAEPMTVAKKKKGSATKPGRNRSR
jgi:lysylphosphatidylglycerol synthetase-like protein (DUF2156 family)